MAQLLFTIANGMITTSGGNRTEQFIASDYRAKSWSNEDRDGIIIYPVFGSDEPYSKGTLTFKTYTEVGLDVGGGPYSPASVEAFVEVFNAICGISIGFNTKYPENLFSQVIELDTSVDEQIVPVWIQTGHNAGYVTITTPSTNTGNVHVGESDVNNLSYYLEPDKSITLEISDLSLIWVQSTTPGDVVMVIGVAKT